MLERKVGEKVGDKMKMKIAIMTSMLPPVIQDLVYQNVSCRHERGVTTMDVGWSDCNEGEEDVDPVGA